MNRKEIKTKAFLSCMTGMLACAGATAQEVPAPTLVVYGFSDNSCLRKVSDNGGWAVSYGASTADGSVWSNARLINVRTGDVTVLGLEGDGDVPLSCMASDVTDDGMVVGSYNNVPATWTAEDGWQELPMPVGWETAQVEAVTPDGRYAVGKAYEYKSSYKETGALWDLTVRELLDTPNSPTTGSNGDEAQMVRYTGITSDGRYISGVVDYSYTWNTLYFIYDREERTYWRPGFNADGTPWTDGLVSASGDFSPDGAWFGGTATFLDGKDEYSAPFRYSMADGTFELFNSTSLHDYGCVSVDNDGVIYASTPATASPVRTLYMLVDGFWYPLDEVLAQRYGIDYYGKSGYDNTGTAVGVSGDGTVLAAFSDPYNGYVLALGESFTQACRSVNLLNAYSATPVDGSAFTKIKDVSVTFNYDVQILGSSDDVTFVDSDGNSPARIITFETLSSSAKTVHIGFRTASLEAGREYTLTIPAGTLALSADKTRTNDDIVLRYTGRGALPVRVTAVSPEDGSSLSQLDVSTNPVLLTFDTNIALAEGAAAVLYRGGEDEPLATLSLSTGLYASNANALLVYPTTTQYLYLGTDYRVVLPAGSVTDVNGDNGNEEFTVGYEGVYERLVVADDTLVYREDFSGGMGNMMLYDGDGNTPDSEMRGYDFAAGHEYAWIPVLDSGDTGYNYAAASTSAYDPVGKSDDWMVTPQVYIPDGKCRLEFLAQGFRNSCEDRLKVIVYESGTVLNYLDGATVEDMRANGTVVMDERVLPGASEDNLAGDWVTYSFDLSGYAGKSIYVAFVNENEAQSLVIVDDIRIIRDNGFLTALSSPTTVVGLASQKIEGCVIANTGDVTFGSVTVRLLDSGAEVVDEVSESSLSLAKGDRYDFSFGTELPLTVGRTNTFYIHVRLDDREDTVKYSIKNLAFRPVKRVVIEENTGMSCGYCPLGYLAWEYIGGLYGDKVAMVSYHAYNGGDAYASGLVGYTQDFLGLTSAPSAKINRGSTVSSPMSYTVSEGKYVYSYSSPDGTNWLDLVQREFGTDADADLSVSAEYDEERQRVSVPFTATFALDGEKRNIGLFLVVTEDNLVGYQDNNLAAYDPDVYIGLGGWVKDGVYGQSRVYPYYHNEVARAQVGTSYYGTTGYIPTTVTNGEEYTGTVAFDLPSTVSVAYNCKVICMMIDANTGAVINSASAPLTGLTGIDRAAGTGSGTVEVARYNAAGQMIPEPQKGLNIIRYSDGTVRKTVVK